MPGLAGLGYRNLSARYGVNPGSAGFGYMRRQQQPYGYMDTYGGGILPGGNLRVSPDMGGQPRSIPGIDVPVPGQNVPNMTGLDYSNTLGLPGSGIDYSVNNPPNQYAAVGGSGIGSTAGQDQLIVNGVQGRGTIPVPLQPGEPNWVYPRATPGGGGPYPTPGGANAAPDWLAPTDWRQNAVRTRTYPTPGGQDAAPDWLAPTDWVQNATNSGGSQTGGGGYPIPGGGQGGPAGNWRTNASRPTPPWGWGPNYVDPRAANAAAFGLAGWNQGMWAGNRHDPELSGNTNLMAKLGMYGRGGGGGVMPGKFK